MREQVRHPAAAKRGNGLTTATAAHGSGQPDPGPEHLTSESAPDIGQDRRSTCRDGVRMIVPMPVTLSAMFISVHDPDAALVFYRDALGLEVRADVASEGFRWVTVGAPGQDVDIVLSQPHGGRSQTEGDALLSLVTQGSLQAAIFRSDDVDATFEKVRASGAEVLQEPTSQPWGVRDCAFRDPSGNLVRIAQG